MSAIPSVNLIAVLVAPVVAFVSGGIYWGVIANPLTKADALPRRTFKSDKRRNHVSQSVPYYFARYRNSHDPGRLRRTSPNLAPATPTEAATTVRARIFK